MLLLILVILMMQFLLISLILSMLLSKQRVVGDKKLNSLQNIVLDTCALIDGRILDLIEGGFFPGCVFFVSNLVLDELQRLADGTDSLKRTRARNGLLILNKIKNLEDANLRIVKHELSGEVDEILLNFAGSHKFSLFTTDVNLTMRARVQGVKVISPVELLEQLQLKVLAGDKLEVLLMQKGAERGQAVGFLEDGTMVIVESAVKLVGKKVRIKVNKVIQSTGGKLIFAAINQG